MPLWERCSTVKNNIFEFYQGCNVSLEQITLYVKIFHYWSNLNLFFKNQPLRHNLRIWVHAFPNYRFLCNKYFQEIGNHACQQLILFSFSKYCTEVDFLGKLRLGSLLLNLAFYLLVRYYVTRSVVSRSTETSHDTWILQASIAIWFVKECPTLCYIFICTTFLFLPL